MKKILLAIITSCMFIYCSSDQHDSKTHFGYPVEYHKHGSGQQADSGMIAKFLVDFKVEGNDSLVMMPRDPSRVEIAQIMTPSQNRDRNPILDALAMMREGDSLTIYVSTDSIPGLSPEFKEYEFIKNVIALRELMTETEFQEEQQIKQAEQQKMIQENKAREADIATLIAEQLAAYKAGAIENLHKLESGLEVQVIEKGDGSKVENGESIEAQYYGVLKSDGSMFDNSFQRGLPFNFNVGRGMVIKGWDEGFQQLNHGDKAILYIPYDMAYGEAGAGGAIPPKSDLAFYVEVK